MTWVRLKQKGLWMNYFLLFLAFLLLFKESELITVLTIGFIFDNSSQIVKMQKMIQFYHINYLFSVLTFPPLPAQIISLFLFFILRLSYLCSHFSLTWSSDYLLLVLTFNLPLPPIFISHSPCSHPPFFYLRTLFSFSLISTLFILILGSDNRVWF